MLALLTLSTQLHIRGISYLDAWADLPWQASHGADLYECIAAPAPSNPHVGEGKVDRKWSLHVILENNITPDCLRRSQKPVSVTCQPRLSLWWPLSLIWPRTSTLVWTFIYQTVFIESLVRAAGGGYSRKQGSRCVYLCEIDANAGASQPGVESQLTYLLIVWVLENFLNFSKLQFSHL